MNYQAFSIRFIPLHYPNLCETSAFSVQSSRMLDSLYRTFSQKLVSAKNAERLAGMIQDSVFCCCLPEGMAMLRATANSANRTVALHGFLVTKDTLRTAWKLSRWKLLFVCVAGWDRQNETTLTLDDIEKIAMSLKVPDNLKKQLKEMSQKMLESPVPFSFSITNLPNHMVPLRFSNTTTGQPIIPESEEASEIPLSVERVQAMLEQFQKEESALKSMRLYCESKKHYYTTRLQYDSEYIDPRELKEQLKEEISQYQGETIWYFSTHAVHNGFYHIRPLTPHCCQTLSKGEIDFSELSFEMERYIAELHNSVGKIKGMMQAAEPPKSAGKSASASRPEEEEHGGILKFLHKKKK